MTSQDQNSLSDYATVAELAQHLRLSRRGAHNLLSSCASYLGITIYAADRNQFQITREDFQRVVELAQVLRTVGLTLRQVETIRSCTDPRLWALLDRTETQSPQDSLKKREELVSRLEVSLTDFIQKQETVMKQQLDLLHHVVSLLPAAPAPTPTPVPAAVRREPRE